MHESMIHLNCKQGIVESVLPTSPLMNPFLPTMTDVDKRNATWYNVFLETDKYIEYKYIKFPSTYLRRMWCVDHGRHDNSLLAMLRANPVANDGDTAAAIADVTEGTGSINNDEDEDDDKEKEDIENNDDDNDDLKVDDDDDAAAIKTIDDDDSKADDDGVMEDASSVPTSISSSTGTVSTSLPTGGSSSSGSGPSSLKPTCTSSSLKKSRPHAATGEAAVSMDIVPPSTPYATGTITKKYFKEYRAWYKGCLLYTSPSPRDSR